MKNLTSIQLKLVQGGVSTGACQLAYTQVIHFPDQSSGQVTALCNNKNLNEYHMQCVVYFYTDASEQNIPQDSVGIYAGYSIVPPHITDGTMVNSIDQPGITTFLGNVAQVGITFTLPSDASLKTCSVSPSGNNGTWSLNGIDAGKTTLGNAVFGVPSSNSGAGPALGFLQ